MRDPINEAAWAAHEQNVRANENRGEKIADFVVRNGEENEKLNQESARSEAAWAEVERKMREGR